MRKYIFLFLLVSLTAVFSQACQLDLNPTDSETDTDKDTTPNGDYEAIGEVINQNQAYELKTPKELDLDKPDKTEKISDTNPGTYSDSSGDYYVTEWLTERKYYSAINNPEEFVLYNANASVLWPGNLIQGNSMTSGALNPIPVGDRKPITVFVSILKGTTTDDSSLRVIDKPNGSSVLQAMNEIIANFYGTSAMINYTKNEVYNSQHLKFNLNAGFSTATTSLDSSLGIDWTKKKKRIMVNLRQQFFSMAIDNPPGWNGVFGPSVKASDLQNYTSSDNPIVYIDSVTYGRVFVYVYETDDESFDLDAKLKVAYDGVAVEGNADAALAYQEVMNKSKVHCFAMGGNAEDALAAAYDFEKLQNYLTNGALLSETSIGVPISYSIRYLKDATILRMNNTMEYYIDTKTPVSKTAMNSKFNIDFDKIIFNGYDDGGPDLFNIQLLVEKYDSASGSYQKVWNYMYKNGDWFWINDNTNYTASIGEGTGFFSLPKKHGEKIKISITGSEGDSDGDTHLHLHAISGTSHYLEIKYDAAKNSWVNADKAQPQIYVRTQDVAHGSEWESAEVYYTISVEDEKPIVGE